jgi:hypothetical protein
MSTDLSFAELATFIARIPCIAAIVIPPFENEGISRSLKRRWTCIGEATAAFGIGLAETSLGWADTVAALASRAAAAMMD